MRSDMDSEWAIQDEEADRPVADRTGQWVCPDCQGARKDEEDAINHARFRNHGMPQFVADRPVADPGKREQMDALMDRLWWAEQVCLLVAWTATDRTDRGKALHERWEAWAAIYESNRGSLKMSAHPELSASKIRALARQYDAKMARALKPRSPSDD